MTGAFQPWGKIDLTSMGDAFELQYPCFAVRNGVRFALVAQMDVQASVPRAVHHMHSIGRTAPKQFWPPGSGPKLLQEASCTVHEPVSRRAKTALCTILRWLV
jgi:hypothetical protein